MIRRFLYFSLTTTISVVLANGQTIAFTPRSASDSAGSASYNSGIFSAISTGGLSPNPGEFGFATIPSSMILFGSANTITGRDIALTIASYAGTAIFIDAGGTVFIPAALTHAGTIVSPFDARYADLTSTSSGAFSFIGGGGTTICSSSMVQAGNRASQIGDRDTAFTIVSSPGPHSGLPGDDGIASTFLSMHTVLDSTAFPRPLVTTLPISLNDAAGQSAGAPYGKSGKGCIVSSFAGSGSSAHVYTSVPVTLHTNGLSIIESSGNCWMDGHSPDADTFTCGPVCAYSPELIIAANTVRIGDRRRARAYTFARREQAS